MMAVFKLKTGTTAAQLKKAVLSNDQTAFEKIALPVGTRRCHGAPASSARAEDHHDHRAPGGHYGIVCFVPAPDGKPHAAHGMYKVFTRLGEVEPEAADRRRRATCR